MVFTQPHSHRRPQFRRHNSSHASGIHQLPAFLICRPACFLRTFLRFFTQHLLHTDAFPGHKTSADWIVSLTAINAPLNGALAAYALGEEEEAAPKVVSWSPGNLLGAVVHVLAFIDCKFLGFDLGMDHWELSWRGSKTRRQEMSFKSAGKCACQSAAKLVGLLSTISQTTKN